MQEMAPPVDYSLPQRTLALILRGNRLLLGEKVSENSKVTVGHGLLNGPGGKLTRADVGETAVWHGKYAETPETCVCRETLDECGLVLSPESLQKQAVISFYWPAPKESWNQLVHVYMCSTFSGEPHDTDEMVGWGWHDVERLPWERMFQADKHWLPHILIDHRTIDAFFHYAPDLTSVRKYDIWDAVSGKRLEEYERLG